MIKNRSHKIEQIVTTIQTRISEINERYRSGPDLYFYKRIYELSNNSNSIDSFLRNNYNIEMLYATLVSWDMNSRGAKMKYFDEFKANILSSLKQLSELESLERSNYRNSGKSIFVLRSAYDNLNLMKSGAKLVSNSKLLHFLFPKSYMPMDRQNTVGVTYKTAWRMFRQIRSMLDEDVMKLLGEVEVDETYVGGKRRGKRGRGAEGKIIVVGAAQRNGKVIARVVPDVKRSTLVPFVARKVSSKDTILYTDEFPSYDHMAKLGYNHKRIEHHAKIYVRGNIHTQTIDGFWSLVKREIDGVHHKVGANYLQDYINAYSFRWNHRNDEKPMFLQILARLVPSLRV